MEALLNRILTLNLIATTVVFYVAARIYLLPQLGLLRPRAVLIPILLLHSLRHLGLMFLTRGATYPGLPPQFAYPAALGDLLTAVLAFVAIFFVSRNSTYARPLVWVFNVFGSIDCSWRLPWRPSTTRLSLWDQPIGSRHFGFLLYWLRTTSHSLS